MSLCKHSFRVLSKATPRCIARSMSSSFNDRERGIENAYFNKEEEKALRKLLTKMKLQADKGDASGAAAHRSEELKTLNAIVGKYNLPSETINAILEWKHTH